MQGRSFSGRERNCVFLNTKQNQFATISAVSGLDFPDDGRCLAVSDWDRDGDLDLWISNRNAPRLRFMRNDTPTKNRSVVIRLRGNGTTSNRDAIGARVEVVLNGDNGAKTQRIQTLRAGEGFLSQSSKWMHFGIGMSKTIEKAIVRWPDGQAQTFHELAGGQRYLLIQGEGVAQPVDPSRSTDPLVPGPLNLPRESRTARIALVTRVPMPSIQYELDDGSQETERFLSGSPTLVNLWASWCSPCLKEMAELTVARRQLLEQEVNVISLSVDRLNQPPASTSEIEMKLKDLNYPFDWGIIDEIQLRQLQELHDHFFFQKRTLPLPTSFLIDAEGRLAIVYRGPVTADQLLEDVAVLSTHPETRWQNAACFPGRQLEHKRVQEITQQADLQRHYHVAAWLEESGRHDDALRHFVHLTQLDSSWAIPHRHLAKIHLRRNDLDSAEASASFALELNPQSPGAHNTMGLIRSRHGDERSAEVHFRKAIKLNDQFAEAYNNLGTTLASQGDIDAASSCFQRALAIDNQFAEAHTNLGRVHALKNDNARAIRHFQLAIRIDPKYVEAYNNLGTMFARQGELREAIKIYREALKLEPNHAEIRRNHDRAVSLLDSR